MIPIGIMSHNRHKYLDVTLRSLSRTKMFNSSVTIFDDASDSPETHAYLYTNEVVELQYNFPKDKHWQAMGLGGVKSRKEGKGIHGQVEVVRLGDTKLGVVNAACAAIQHLCAMYPEDSQNNGIIVLQDDVVFNTNWQARLRKAGRRLQETGQDPGLLAGCALNRSFKGPPNKAVNPGKKAPTAQCYYIFPCGLRAAANWIDGQHDVTKGFDNKLCAVIKRKHKIYVMNPAVCQHIGIVSKVRGWNWRWCNVKGRVAYQARGPFPLAKDVKQFMGTDENTST